MASTIHPIFTVTTSTAKTIASNVIKGEMERIENMSTVKFQHLPVFKNLCVKILLICWKPTPIEALQTLAAESNDWLNILFDGASISTIDSRVIDSILESVHRLIHSLPAINSALKSFSETLARKNLISDIFTPVFPRLRQHGCHTATDENVLEKLVLLDRQGPQGNIILNRELNRYGYDTSENRRRLLTNYREVANFYNMSVGELIEYVKVRNERNSYSHFNQSMHTYRATRNIPHGAVHDIRRFLVHVGINDFSVDIWKNTEPERLQLGFQEWYSEISQYF